MEKLNSNRAKREANRVMVARTAVNRGNVNHVMAQINNRQRSKKSNRSVLENMIKKTMFGYRQAYGLDLRTAVELIKFGLAEVVCENIDAFVESAHNDIASYILTRNLKRIGANNLHLFKNLTDPMIAVIYARHGYYQELFKAFESFDESTHNEMADGQEAFLASLIPEMEMLDPEAGVSLTAKGYAKIVASNSSSFNGLETFLGLENATHEEIVANLKLAVAEHRVTWNLPNPMDSVSIPVLSAR